MMNLAAFLSYVAVANVSPGPNAIISMSNAGRYELKKSIRFNIGISAGVFFVMLLCSVFSLTVVRVFPSVQPVLIWIGAGYILWLAYQTWISKPVEGGGKETSGSLFLQGALLQFVNPNTILYGIFVFATFIVPFYQSLLHLALFSAFLSAAAFIGTGCWTLFGSFFRGFVNRHFKLVNGILTGLLVYCAVSLVW